MTSSTTEPAADGGWEKDKQEWLDAFAEDYGEKFEHQAVGIVARATYHEKVAPSGADASYITTKLEEIVADLLRKERVLAAFDIEDIAREEGAKAERERILAALPKDLVPPAQWIGGDWEGGENAAYSKIRHLIQSPPTSKDEQV